MRHDTYEQVSVTAPKESGGGKGPGKLRSVVIDVAENGFTVRCTRETTAAKKGDYPPYVPPKDFVFESAEAALEYVSKELGAKEPAEAA